MLTDYAAAGLNELWSMPRLQAYLTNVGSPFTTGANVCGCDTLTAAAIDLNDDAVYQTPALDPAPWYDVDLPESADFLGFMPLSITGLEDNPRARNVTNTVGGGGIFGPQRDLPRTITVTGLLIGASCCGSEYGLHYLSEALSGCTGDTCDGDCLTMFNCCPDTVLTKADLNAAHRRTFRRSALISGPTITDRVGSGTTCARGTCGANGDIIQVEFVIVAASPWPWTDATPLLDVGWPIGGTGDCIDWCVRPGTVLDAIGGHTCAAAECSFMPCESVMDACADPLKSVLAPPQPTTPDAGFCVPIAPEQQCYTIDLTNRPQWSSDVPMITVLAGSSELRNVGIRFFEKPTGTTQTCDEIADANRCAPLMEFFITYIPAGGAVTIDGQIGRATIECDGECRAASNVYGDQNGGPVKISELNCAQLCVCLESDPLFPPAADASFSLSVSGRGY
jgi:hypothetical protein